MTDDPSGDLKSLWRSQPEEISPMTLADIRRKAGAFQRRKRLVNAVEYLATAIVVVAFALYLRYLPGVLIKLASALVIAWAVFYVWQRRRLMSARPLPEDAAACLDFHRGELERQRRAVRGAWRWTLAPLAPVMILFVLGRWFELPVLGRTPWVDHLIIVQTSFFLLESLVLAWLWLDHRADRIGDQIDQLDASGSPTP